MRLLTLLSLPVVTCGLALAAQGPEGFTYVDGNVTELTANTGGTVSFASDKAVELKTGSNKVEIPYASISKAELGITKVHSPQPEPLYKVWALQKRFMGKTQTQQVTVAFTSNAGEERTMTLELSKSAAAEVLTNIQRHQPKAPEAWWGDKIWKTASNADQWAQPSTIARK